MRRSSAGPRQSTASLAQRRDAPHEESHVVRAQSGDDDDDLVGSSSSSNSRGDDPILPRTKVDLFADEENEWTPTSFEELVARRHSWSQTTTTRTADIATRTYTTKRTEHQTWSYSVSSASMLDLSEDGDEDPFTAPFARSHRHRAQLLNTGSARLSSTASRPTISHRASLLLLHDHHSGPPWSEPASSGSFHTRRQPPFRASPASHFKKYRPTVTTQPNSSPNSHAISSGYRVMSAPHVFRSLFKVFFVVVVATVAFFSVSTLLLASFGLSLFDDCGRRIQGVRARLGQGRRLVRRGFQGVRSGVYQLLSDTRELAGYASGFQWAPSNPSGAVGHGEVRQPERRARSLSLFGGIGRTPQKGDYASRGPPVCNQPFTAAFQSRRQGASALARSEPGFISDDEEATLHTDYDTRPFVVPNSTPALSKRACHFAAVCESAQTARTERPTRLDLPPRPPLIYLVPLMSLAILYTVLKVAVQYWTRYFGPRRHPKANSS